MIGPMSHASIVFVDPVDSYDFIFNDYLSVSSPVNIHVSLHVHTCLLVPSLRYFLLRRVMESLNADADRWQM